MRPLRETGVACRLERSVDSGGTAAIVAPEIAVFSKCLREKRAIGGRVYRRIGRNGSDSSIHSPTYGSLFAKAFAEDSDFWSHYGCGSAAVYAAFEPAGHAGFAQGAHPAIGVALVL